MNIIETKNLCYSYEEGKPALDNVSISFPKGKCTAVLGGNGAGKSTLFLNLNGVLTPDSGEVFLDGERISYRKKDLLEVRRKIGIVFQDPNDQLFSASVRKDISFGAVNLGLPKEEVERRVEEAIRDTGIAQLSDRPTHALSCLLYTSKSGGGRRRCRLRHRVPHRKEAPRAGSGSTFYRRVQKQGPGDFRG